MFVKKIVLNNKTHNIIYWVLLMNDKRLINSNNDDNLVISTALKCFSLFHQLNHIQNFSFFILLFITLHIRIRKIG